MWIYFFYCAMYNVEVSGLKALTLILPPVGGNKSLFVSEMCAPFYTSPENVLCIIFTVYAAVPLLPMDEKNDYN